MNIDDIRQLVNKDMVMDETALDIESMKTPQLHNRYLIIFTDEKLILGTVQFGLDYGITNKNGKLTEYEIEKIFNFYIS